MSNTWMKNYWNGYHHAENIAYDCGISAAWDEYSFGLNGCGVAFCKGFRRYLDTHTHNV